jgi:hypothetical protein
MPPVAEFAPIVWLNSPPALQPTFSPPNPTGQAAEVGIEQYISAGVADVDVRSYLDAWPTRLPRG